jgi:hypothetical protein
MAPPLYQKREKNFTYAVKAKGLQNIIPKFDLAEAQRRKGAELLFVGLSLYFQDYYF